VGGEPETCVDVKDPVDNHGAHERRESLRGKLLRHGTAAAAAAAAAAAGAD